MIKETKNWLKKADEDLETARYNLEGNRPAVAVFFSQQAAEKALKALQIQMQGKFDRIHDLLTLADSVKAPNEIMNCCIKLTPYYTITRYPDVGEPISEGTAKELLDKSKKVVKWVKQVLR